MPPYHHYIGAVRIERDGEQYGTHYQAVRSYRKSGKVKQEVVHLGQHSAAQSALEAWPHEIQELGKLRPTQADRLQRMLDLLRELS
jgi:hypothetical protein